MTKTSLRCLSMVACVGFLTTATPAAGALWTQDYGDNLWPNGTSEFAPPAGADLNSLEWKGRTNEAGAAADSNDSYGRVIVDPINSGGYTEMCLSSVPVVPGQLAHFTVSYRAVTGNGVSIAVIPTDANGNTLSDRPGWVQFHLVESGNPYKTDEIVLDVGPAGTLVKKVDFCLRAHHSTLEGKAFFDNIIARVYRRTVPAGTIMAWAGPLGIGGSVNVPPGWLPCMGGSFQVSYFPSLYAAIGTTWGSNGGWPQLPDFQGRTLVGNGHGTGLTNRIIGEKGGEESHVLTVAEMPPHSHAGGNNGSHTGEFMTFSNPVSGWYDNLRQNTSGSVGGGQPHNNMPPFAVVQYIIAY